MTLRVFSVNGLCLRTSVWSLWVLGPGLCLRSHELSWDMCTCAVQACPQTLLHGWFHFHPSVWKDVVGTYSSRKTQTLSCMLYVYLKLTVVFV